MGLNPIKSSRHTLGDDAYKELKENIISLRLKPGEMVYESAVASSLGVSRTPIRDAFNRLEQEELLHIMPQRGAYIAPISRKKIKEAQYIRETLELRAFKEITAQWDEGQDKFRQAEQDIRHIIADQKHAIQQGRYVEFIALDAAFHTHVVKLLDNQSLLHVLDMMRSHMNRMRYLELQEGRHELVSIHHHEELVELLKQGDVEKTEACLLSHLRYIVNDWPKIIEKYEDYFVD